MLPESYITCLCPACFKTICLGDCRIINAKFKRVIEEAPLPENRDYACQNVKPLSGQFYTSQEAQRECPECKYLLPYNIELVPNVIIAVVGDPFSGKSHYIAALIEQLEHHWKNQLSDISATLICLTKEVREKYEKELVGRIFDDKISPDRNLPATNYVEPLIYKFTIESKYLFIKYSKTYNIMIYDTAGEDFANTSQLLAYGVFALHTNAFIFVADPVPIKLIFNNLPANLQKHPQLQLNHKEGRRPAEIVTSVIDTFQRYHDIKHSLSSIPIAIMISKTDLFRRLAIVARSATLSYPYRFMTNPSYGSKVDLEDLRLVDKEVRELLNLYGQGDLFAVTNRFNRVSFFATSATGESPDDNGRLDQVRPCRCLDPLLWIFNQLGIIGSKGSFPF